MKINIISYEDVGLWIFGKFAKKLHEHLTYLGYESKISNAPDSNYDINHHISYLDFNGLPCNIDTLMITHVDNLSKFQSLKQYLKDDIFGICMSKGTVNYLATLGIDRKQLGFVNPAHDGIIQTRRINVGITCRVQPDGRKREYFLNEIADIIDPALFKFTIMGDGWGKNVDDIRKKGFEVIYYKEFDYDVYVSIFQHLDYYLYTGMDEGQMGFIDAAHGGVKTIVTKQGYHLDAVGGVTYPYEEIEELREIFSKINADQANLVYSVKNWNWLDYTKKHVEIWTYLYNIKHKISPLPTPSYPVDGLRSLSGFSEADEAMSVNKYYLMFKLLTQKLKHVYYLKIKNRNAKY